MEVVSMVNTTKLFFQIRVQARDLGAPARYNYTVCTVSVQKNFNPPFFTDDSYAATILETFTLGDTILTVSANDNDPLVSDWTLC